MTIKNRNNKFINLINEKKAYLGLNVETWIWIILFIMLFSFLAYKLLKGLIG